MKAGFVAAGVAALAGVSAAKLHHRHAHQVLQVEERGEETCTPKCTTVWTTFFGEPTLVPIGKPSSTYTPPTSVPTLIEYVCPTPGTYTFPEKTVTLTETTTVCGASTTKVPSGKHTLGGVTTVVETATVVTCPYATTTVNNGVVTSTIATTTYVCPTAGTYTIAPVTTEVVTETVVVIPVIETYCPGTYTAPKKVVTVTETDFTTYCPFTAPTSTSAPEPSKSATPSSAPVVPKGGKGGIAYTPYTQGGSCKDAAAVLADIKIIKDNGFDWVRIYSTDCDSLNTVGDACHAHGIKLVIGIFIDSPGCTNSNPSIEAQISAIVAWPRLVELTETIIVGNEAIFNGHCTIKQLKDLIVTVKTRLSGCGYTGHITTTEITAVWQQPEIVEIIDVITHCGLNTYAYFNADTPAHEAGPFLHGQHDIVKTVCSKTVIIYETGWPSSSGNGPHCNGAACASTTDQDTAIKSIWSTCGSAGISVTVLGLWNDYWKGPSHSKDGCNIECFWGLLGDDDGNPTSLMTY